MKNKYFYNLNQINITIFFHFIFIITFDYIKDDIRLIIAGLISLSYIYLSIKNLLGKPNYIYTKLFFSSFLIILAWIISYYFVETQYDYFVSIEQAFRKISPFFAGLAIISERQKISLNLIIYLCILILSYATIYAFIQEKVELTGTLRLSPFSSGLHTSSYQIAGIVILIYELYRSKKISKYTNLILCLLGFFLIIGYHVRTSQLLLIIYFFNAVYADIILKKLNSIYRHYISACAMLIILSILLIISVNISYDHISNISSGRIDNYISRIEIIQNRTILEFLVGNGPGSDFIYTDIWWWEEKDSHSDWLQFFWEGGFLATLGFAYYLITILKINTRSLFPIIFSLSISSLISNAVFARPNASFIYFLSISLILNVKHSTLKK